VIRVAGLSVLVALLLCGCSASSESVPTSTPRGADLCGTSPSRDGAGGPLITVDSNPTGLISEWVSGQNVQPCQEKRFASSAAVAKELAGAIRSAAKFPSGKFNCPGFDNGMVRLFFTFRNSPAQLVDVLISGCVAISGPERSSRRITNAVAEQLVAIAPPKWNLSGL
jgi:hypothetical protein